jgi:hypothetical protein
MGKYDFLFSTPQNSYLDQALPPISAAPQLAAPQLAAPQTVAARPQLSNEMMMALTGRNMTRPMSLPISKPRRPYSGAMPMSKPQTGGYSGPLPMSKPQRGYSGPLPISKPAMPAAPRQQAAPQGFLEGLLGSGFDDPRTQGIMAASAALLEGGGPVVGAPAPSLGQSIGRAFNAYNTGRMGAEDRIAAQGDRDFNKRYKEMQMREMENRLDRADDPILQDIQGGAFTRVTDPVTGDSKIVRNDKVADFLAEQKKRSKTINVKLSDKQIENQTDDLDNLRSTQDLLGEAEELSDMIANNEILFGAKADIKDFIVGRGPESFTSDKTKALTANKQRFDRFLQNLRNQIMVQAKGVQTEGDAERALTMLATAEDRNDPTLMEAAVQELIKTQKKIIRRTKAKVQDRRVEKGLKRYDFSNMNPDGIGYTIVKDS